MVGQITKSMKKALITVAGISILISFVLWINQVQPLKTDLKESEEKSKEEVINENKIENLKLNNLFDTKGELCRSNLRKHDILVKTTNNYLQRYVSLFLVVSNLRDRQVNNVDEEITIDLEISIAGGDLAYLQRFSKNVDQDYLINYSKLDKIFSKIAKKKEESYIKSALNSSRSFFLINFFSLVNILNHYNVLLFLIILTATWLILKYCNYKCVFMYLVSLINSVIIWESVNLYWKNIKEAEINIFVKKMELGNRAECEFEKMSWYKKIQYSIFNGNKACVEFYQNLHKSAEDEVSLFNCIIKTYSFYFIQTPMNIFGASIRDLTQEISASLPWPLHFFINVPISIFLICIILFVILILCGKRLRLSFFGASMEIGDTSSIAESNSITNGAKRENLLLKSRRPKRLKMDISRLRKPFLKTSKSVNSVLNKKKSLEFRNESSDHSEPESQ